MGHHKAHQYTLIRGPEKSRQRRQKEYLKKVAKTSQI